MRLYDYGPSRNCYKVRLLATHLGLQLTRIPVDIFQGGGATPEFLAKNPMGTVPVLEYDAGKFLPESNAILTFLAEGTPYLPADREQRADVIRWLLFEQLYVQTSVGLLRYWSLTGKIEKYKAAVAPRRALGERALGVLDQTLGRQPFIAGERYTIADMSLFAYCYLAGEGGFDLAKHAHLLAWFDRVRCQPGFLDEAVPYSVDPASGGNLPLAG